MMKWNLALKSGAVAGAIYGLLSGFVALAVAILNKDQIIEQIQAQFANIPNVPVTAEDVYPLTLAAAVPGAIFSGLIIGIVLGVVFMLLREDLLGKNSAMKGVCLSGLLLIGLGIGEAISPGTSLAFVMVQTSFILLTPVNVVLFLLFGFMLGKFHDRFESKK